jgi:hypothetical protein
MGQSFENGQEIIGNVIIIFHLSSLSVELHSENWENWEEKYTKAPLVTHLKTLRDVVTIEDNLLSQHTPLVSLEYFKQQQKQQTHI